MALFVSLDRRMGKEALTTDFGLKKLSSLVSHPKEKTLSGINLDVSQMKLTSFTHKRQMAF